MQKRRIVLIALVAVWLASLLCAVAPAMARSPFDGSWSVSVITDAGECDRAYRYALHILNGRIYYDDPSFDISGQVDARGRVRVTINYGQRRAVGSGRLAADYGEGVWSGRSSTTQCSGHWEAERRQ